jgi:hypothetical protein
MRLVPIIGLASACLAHPALAEAPRPANPELAKIASEFFLDLQQGKSSEAYHGAFRDTEAALGSQAIDSVAAQTDGLLKTFGKVEDWSLVGEDRVTPTLIRDLYYVRCQAVPMFFELQFYKSSDGAAWKVINVQMGAYANMKAGGYLDTLSTGLSSAK